MRSFLFLLLVAGTLACGDAPTPPPTLDVDAPFALDCDGSRPCWSFDDGAAGWTVTGTRSGGAGTLGVVASGDSVRITTPVLHADGPSVLTLHLQAGADLRVLWLPESGGEEVLGEWRRPQPWWIGRWHAATLPAGRDGRVALEARGGRPGSPAIVLSFAELLTHGHGRCYRDEYVAVTPPVTVRPATVCVPPAEAELVVPAATRALRLLAAKGYEGATGRVTVHEAEGADGAALHQARPLEPGRWVESVVAVAETAAERRLRVRVESETDRRGTVAWVLEATAAPRSPRPPNVLVYMIDTLRADGLDLAADGRTPTFAALAARGTVFTDVVAPAPWTLPSVVSLFTGLGVAAHGVVSGQDMLRDELVPIAERFREAGYRTVAFSTNPYVSTRHRMHRGFEAFGRVFAPSGPHGVENGRTSSMVNEAAIPWIRAHAAEPFFAYLHVMDPHQPYTPLVPPDRLAHAVGLPMDDPRWALVRFPSQGRGPRGWGAVDEMDPERARPIVEKSRRLYDATIGALDGNFAVLMSVLEELGIAGNTLIVVTADHGEEFHEHGLTGHGHALYGEQLSVPLIVAHSERVPAGRRIGEAVELTGLASTLLGLAGISGPAGDGRMLELLRGNAPDDAFEPAVAMLYAPAATERAIVSEAVVTPRWKLIRNSAAAAGRPGAPAPPIELYDRARDPVETRNLAAEQPEVVAELVRVLDAQAGLQAAPQAPGLDQATRDRLRALGYAVD